MDEKFTLTIDLGNAAMSTPRDVALALRFAADQLHTAGDLWAGRAVAGNIRDANGNTVGSWELLEGSSDDEPLDWRSVGPFNEEFTNRIAAKSQPDPAEDDERCANGTPGCVIVGEHERSSCDAQGPRSAWNDTAAS